MRFVRPNYVHENSGNKNQSGQVLQDLKSQVWNCELQHAYRCGIVED